METVVSIFSGAGGLSLGFARAGLKPVLGVDINRDTCNTYETNLGIPCYNLDLNADDQSEIMRLMEPYKQPFAVIGGPPCQGFSTAGDRTGHDPRNHLIFNYFELVKYLQPRWFLFENVEGLLTSNRGQSIYKLVQQFLSLGYSLRLEKVNFAAYGLPQSRKRVIIIGNRLGLPFWFPEETHSFESGKHKSISLFPNAPSFLEAVGGLPPTAQAESVLPYEGPPASDYDALMRQGNEAGAVIHHFSAPSALDIERYLLLLPGQTMKDMPESLWHPSFRKRAFRRVMDGTPTEKRGGAPSGIKRLHGNLCSLTITSAASREFIHPTEQRPLTLREAARLQSFPDAFTFTGTASSIATQIGNAFPPMTAEIFARHLLHLEEKVVSGQKLHRSCKAKLVGFRLTDAKGKSPALAQTERLLQSLAQNPVCEGVLNTLYG